MGKNIAAIFLIMQKKLLHKKISSVPVHTWLLLAVVCLIGYWPISTNLFSLKNDAYIYFLPCRYFVSESIQSGHFPLWNPYFYMGFPLHGDMQGGVWNPIVLFISLFSKYNMTTLQYETLLYIYIGGIGMYKLLSIFNTSQTTKLVLAISYMFCGFIIDTGQITVWTGSAAFVPFVLLYYSRILLLQGNPYNNALKTSIAYYFLLTAGYPSFVIMLAYILFVAFLSTLISGFRNKTIDKKTTFTLLRANALAATAFLLIALPALISYYGYRPYYLRSAGTILSEAQMNPFNLFAVVSYLFPLSVTKTHEYLTTDPTARSGYIGLFALLLFAGIIRKKLTGMQIFIAATTIIIFLFSLGDAVPVRKFFFDYVPLMNFFRHPGTMRLFTTCGLLLLSSFFMDDFFIALKNKDTKFYLNAASIALLGIAAIMLIQSSNSHLAEKIILFKTNFATATDKRSFIKIFYDNFSFSDAVMLEGFLQILFLLCFIFLIIKNKKSGYKWLIAICIINPIVLAQFSIPATFVTQQPPSKINNFINASPVGYPLPDINTSIATNNAIEETTNGEFGCSSFYSKKIVQAKNELNPSFTESLREFDNATALSKIVMKYPVCYFSDTIVRYDSMNTIKAGSKKILFTNDNSHYQFSNDTAKNKTSIIIKKFTPWGLEFETETLMLKPFVLFQTFNENWGLYVDNQRVGINKGNVSFIYATIYPGKHTLQFFYRPRYLFFASAVAVISVLLIMLLLIINKDRK